jgi:hypothetical protein
MFPSATWEPEWNIAAPKKNISPNKGYLILKSLLIIPLGEFFGLGSLRKG